MELEAMERWTSERKTSIKDNQGRKRNWEKGVKNQRINRKR